MKGHDGRGELPQAPAMAQEHVAGKLETMRVYLPRHWLPRRKAFHVAILCRSNSCSNVMEEERNEYNKSLLLRVVLLLVIRGGRPGGLKGVSESVRVASRAKAESQPRRTRAEKRRRTIQHLGERMGWREEQ